MGILSDALYYFRDVPQPHRQQVASRAALEQFQSYPTNEVQGRGTLVSQNGLVAGKYWNVIQPPQVFAAHTGTTDNILGAGTQAGGFYGTPLIPNPDSPGMS